MGKGTGKGAGLNEEAVKEDSLKSEELHAIGGTTSDEESVKRNVTADAWEDPIERVPFFAAVTTYLGYAWLILLGFIRDNADRLMRLLGHSGAGSQMATTKRGYAPLLADWENFYYRRLYLRTHDVFDRPVCSAPGPYIDVAMRKFTMMQSEIPETGEKKRCLNLGSYNYLGFATNGGAEELVFRTLEQGGVSTCSTRTELGTMKVHQDLEANIADFVGKEAAIVVSMGFATNSTLIPSLVGKGSLIISDALNHTSIVYGSSHVYRRVQPSGPPTPLLLCIISSAKMHYLLCEASHCTTYVKCNSTTG
eukprot:SAG31_NODE_9119_length_1330_cov_1.632819_1_plen_307_part_01